MKNIVKKHQINLHLILLNAPWVEKITPKASLGNSPFFMVYGREAVCHCWHKSDQTMVLLKLPTIGTEVV